MNTIPDHAEEITTYPEFNQVVVAPFFQGRYSSVIVLGRPGLGKSQHFQRPSDETSHWVHGWTKPVQTLIDVYRHRHKRLVFDDTESLWKTDLGRVLIRSLTEMVPCKTIQVTTTNNELRNAGIPANFQTSSKCAFLANNFRFGKADECEAILDRSQVFYFNPTASEVHQAVGEWLWPAAQDIYDFVGQRLHMLSNHSMRTYLKLWDRKQAGGDWQQMLYQRFCLSANKQLVLQCEADWRLKSVEEKVDKFTAAGGGVRSTYFYIKKQLGQDGQLQLLDPADAASRVLTGKPPTELQLQPEATAAIAEPWTVVGDYDSGDEQNDSMERELQAG